MRVCLSVRLSLGVCYSGQYCLILGGVGDEGKIFRARKLNSGVLVVGARCH